MTQQEAKDKELNPHNYNEGRFKYPLNHRACGRTVYFYKTKPHIGEFPAFEKAQRISLKQPTPMAMGNISCPYCELGSCSMDLTVNEAREMS
jgi:hypothetical protein